MVRSTINMFIVLGSAGLGVTSTKYIAEYREKQADKIPAVYAATNYFGLFNGYHNGNLDTVRRTVHC